MSQEEDARRDLKRLEEQSEKILGAPSVAEGGEDRIEALGKRIARMVTYVAAGFLIYWLFSQLP